MKLMILDSKENGIQETPSIYIEKALIFKRLGFYSLNLMLIIPIGHSDTLEALFIEMESKGLTRPLNSQNLLW